jgi:hypothetical protein
MNKKISALTALGTTPAVGDIIPITDVSDTTGSAQGTTKKVTVANLVAAAPVQSVAGRTGTVTLSNTDISGLGSAATTASTDYATAAQGATADSATQPSDNISTLTNDSNFIDSSGAPVQSVAGRTGTVTIDAGDLTDGDFGGTAILGFDATLNDQTGTTYTILSSDAGKVITCNNGSAVTVTVPASLGAGFTCSVVQKGAGQVTFSASSTTINNRQSHTKIAGQHGVATLVSTASDVFVLAGDTARRMPICLPSFAGVAQPASGGTPFANQYSVEL